jgi:ATP-dependent RNA helicase DDX10/DBP4
MATSRKALSKRAERGTKLKFDDDGVAHAVYDLESEADFLAQGSPEELKRKFVEETAEKLKRVDEDDREEAMEKRRQKRLKREKVVDL